MPAPASLIKRQLNECWNQPSPSPQLSEGAEAWLESRVHSRLRPPAQRRGKRLQVDQHRKRQEALSLKPCPAQPTPHVTLQQPSPQWAGRTQGLPALSDTREQPVRGSCGLTRTGRQYLQTRLWGWGSYFLTPILFKFSQRNKCGKIKSK